MFEYIAVHLLKQENMRRLTTVFPFDIKILLFEQKFSEPRGGQMVLRYINSAGISAVARKVITSQSKLSWSTA